MRLFETASSSRTSVYKRLQILTFDYKRLAPDYCNYLIISLRHDS